VFETKVGGEFLELTVTAPRQLATAVLWNLMRHLRENGLDTAPQEFAFWSRIARTFAIWFAALLAVPFVFGNLRSAGSGARLLIGVMIGLSFFLLQRLLESGTIVFNANPIVLAWTPSLLLADVSLVLIARTR
jgi:lipopolysaccharide export system permease protein